MTSAQATAVSPTVTSTLIAGSPFGLVHLTVQLADPPAIVPCAIADALHMGAIERHLDFLSYWLGVNLDPMPTHPESEPSTPALLTLGSGGEDDVRVTVRIDSAVWKDLPVIDEPATRVGWKLHWERHAARFVFDAFTLGGEDRERVAPGAFVLLPASFATSWRTRLRLAGTSIFREGRYDPAASRWQVDTDDAGAGILQDNGNSDVAPSASVSFGTRVSTRLFTIDAQTSVEVGAGVESLDCVLTLRADTGVIAFNGQLVPLARGYGLRVSERWT